MAAVGQVLNGRYRLVELLGEGGMATVYRGHDTQLGRDVAVKVLRADYGRDPAFVTRFRQEAQSAAALNHPNVVNVYDYGMEAGDPFIVMELVEGGDLAEILRERGALDPLAAARVAQQVADALDVAHGRGIVHRDIKTTNVMITRSGRVKVGDFGIARAFSEAQITLPGTTLGSVHYFSPEQARGELVTTASDVYSLGLVLFEMLTGRRAWTGDSAGAVAVARLAGDPPLPSTINPEVPHALDVIVHAALAKVPSDRPTAGQLSALLNRFIANPGAAVVFGPQPSPMAAPAPPGRTALAGAAASTAGRAAASPATAPAQPSLGTYGGTYAGRRAVARPQALPVREPTEDEEEGTGPWPWVAAVLGVLVLVAGGVLLFLILNGRNNPGPLATPTAGLVEVPNFIGQDFPTAKAAARGVGIVLTIGGSRLMSDDTPENQIVAQDRLSGDHISVGSEVSVIVATHSDTVAVPDLKNRTEAELVALLLSVRLTPGARSTDYSLDVLATNVIGTEPRAGIRVAPGTVVDYVVSLGPPPSPSPTPAPTPTPPPTPPPTPTSSAPPTPSLPPTPSPIIIVITPEPTASPTPEPATVTLANYKCSTLQQAIDAITALNLVLGDVDPAEAKLDASNYLVLFQYPLPGATAYVGTAVNFFTGPLDAQCP